MNRIKSVQDSKDKNLKLYHDGIEALKHYELNDKLKTEGEKSHLIDIYNKEKEINNFRDSVYVLLTKFCQEKSKIYREF
jgi:hypothetical protein